MVPDPIQRDGDQWMVPDPITGEWVATPDLVTLAMDQLDAIDALREAE